MVGISRQMVGKRELIAGAMAGILQIPGLVID
jgi:hypothetical protein